MTSTRARSVTVLALASAAVCGVFVPAVAQKPDYAAEAAQSAAACENGDGAACYRRGELADRSYPGHPANPDEGQRYFARGCEAGYAKACRYEASYWSRSFRDPKKARSLYAKACDLGDQDACGLSGMMLAMGVAGPADYPAARRAFDKQCQYDMARGTGSTSKYCKGEDIIAKEQASASQKSRRAQPPVRTAASAAPRVRYSYDPWCHLKYESILALTERRTDAEIAWALDYEEAQRNNWGCPQNFPARPGYIPPQSETARIPEGRSRRRGSDNSRSGYTSCTKSNGSPGQRYWYYGFDNKRNEGPCL